MWGLTKEHHSYVLCEYNQLENTIHALNKSNYHVISSETTETGYKLKVRSIEGRAFQDLKQTEYFRKKD